MATGKSNRENAAVALSAAEYERRRMNEALKPAQGRALTEPYRG